MDSGELLELFYNRTYEKFVNKQILDDKNFIVPRQQLTNYVRELIDIPYLEFINYLKNRNEIIEVKSTDVTYFNSFSACEIDMCNALIWANNPGCTFTEIGRLFPEKVSSRNDIAYRLYGEQIKAATQLGLTFEYYDYWYLSCIGYIYPDLNEDERIQLLARTITRNNLYRKMLVDIMDHDVYPELYLAMFSGIALKNRIKSVVTFFDICIQECELNNISTHRLYRRNANIDSSVHSNSLSYVKISSIYSLYRSYELLSFEETITLFQRYNYRHDRNAFDKLVKSFLRLVLSIAKLYEGKGLELDDLIQEGTLGLIKAVKKYDYTQGISFGFYARTWIKQSIIHAINTKSLTVQIPQNILALYNKVRKEIEKFEQKNEYNPSITEIEIGEELEQESLSYLGNLPNNLNNTCVLCENLDVFEDNHNDVLNYENNDYNKEYVKMLLSRLSQREQDILKKIYGIGVKEETLDAIGEYYGLTRERARQIKEKAVRKLRDIKNIVWTKLGKTELRMIRFGEEAKTKDTQDVKATSIIKDTHGQLSSNSANDITSISQINKTDQANTEKERIKTIESEFSDQPNTYEVVDKNAASTNEPFIDKECISLSTEKIYEVFNNVVSTYKFYWFISILQIYQKTKSPKIYVYDIIARMIANAWRQITCYRLSFGSSDSLQKIVSELQVLTVIPNEAKIDSVYNILIRRQKEPLIRQQMQILTRNVPSRFLTPWKRSLSDEESYDSECLYSLIMDDENPYISINPLWSDYLEHNYKELMDFSYKELASFLKKRNPNVKDILSKIKGLDNVKYNNPQGYTVVNMGNQCGIFDDYGVQVFSSTGRIKELHSAFYRFYYTYSSFTVNIIQHDEEMRFSIGKRIINVSYKTPLYKALDENRWLEQIEIITYKEKWGYSIKVSNKWYDDLGNNQYESSDGSTAQAIIQEKGTEKGLPTVSTKNETNKLPFEKEKEENNGGIDDHIIDDQHIDKKSTFLSYNGHEFRWNVGDYVTLGFLFSGPIAINRDPFFLFRKNILFVFMKSRTANRNALDSGIYLLPTDTQIFKKQFLDKYGSRTPRILFFIYERPTAVQFLDEVKIRVFARNYIRFDSLLSQKNSSSVGIKSPSSPKSLYANNNNKGKREQEVIKEALVGDKIIYNSKQGTVIEKKNEKGIRRLIIKYDDGTLDNVPNYRNRYQVI